jgi:MFS family permease
MEKKSLFFAMLLGSISGVVCSFLINVPMDLLFAALFKYNIGYGVLFFMTWGTICSFVNGLVISSLLWQINTKGKLQTNIRLTAVIGGILIGLLSGVVLFLFLESKVIRQDIHYLVGLGFNGGLIGYFVTLYLQKNKSDFISIIDDE